VQRMDRYSADYSRWNEWQPTDAVSKQEVCVCVVGCVVGCVGRCDDDSYRVQIGAYM
jgi:hypothetical protein